MKRFADTGETAITIPVIVKPIQIQVALISVPVQIRHMAVTVKDTGRII